MATYRYECKRHGFVDVDKVMALSGVPEWCARCLAVGHVDLPPMRRIFTPQSFILRPSGWHLRPGDKGYGNFNRELELGEVRGPSHERSPVVVEEAAKPVPLVMPDDVMQEIHEFGRVVDRQIREEMALPSAVLDLV